MQYIDLVKVITPHPIWKKICQSSTIQLSLRLINV